MTAKLISFWDLLNENSIKVPIIQRDYAQGRPEQSPLRVRFLASLKTTLDTSQELTLDFVFGSVENGEFKPIDGQQRLTTLWLLHWYVALKAGKLKEVGETLKNFSYETRISSREFCEKICDPNRFIGFTAERNDSGIVKYIVTQTWFYKKWLQDPTISGMLRMLGSLPERDSIKVKSEETRIDNIEKLFKESSVKFEEYWRRLTEEKLIKFYYVPVGDYGLHDDLYIKINARGKQLTSYENFKADLINSIRKEGWEDLLDSKKGIAIKMDTKWTDIFWKHTKERGTKYNIDGIYFAFLNRFFTNELLLPRDENAELKLKAILKDGGQLSSYFPSVYAGLKPYLLGSETFKRETFDKLMRIMDNYYDVVINCEKWIKYNGFLDSEELSNFIPEYAPVEGSSQKSSKQSEGGLIQPVKTITLIEQIWFFSICKYFDEGEWDEVSFQRWIRVVKNLISGKDLSGDLVIRSSSEVKKTIDLLEQLKSHEVYSSLATRPITNSDIDSDARLAARWNEEIEKARKIQEDDTWEVKIKEAEKYGFFDGAIRFLFHDEESNVNWSDFDKKFKWVKEHFASGKPIKIKERAFRDDIDGVKTVQLLKALFVRFSEQEFEDVAYWKYRVFNNYANTWRYFLLNKKIARPVHQLLTSDDKKNQEEINKKKEVIGKDSYVYKLLFNKIDMSEKTALLDFVVDKIPDSWIRYWRGHLSIFPSSRGVFLDATNRDHFIYENIQEKKISLINSNNIVVPNTKYLWGAHVLFVYKGQVFNWDQDDLIYLMGRKDDDNYVRKVRNQDGATDDERFYRINSKIIDDKSRAKTNDEILDDLQKLIVEIQDKDQSNDSDYIH